MTFNFVEKVFSIGNSDVPSPIQFYKRGFVLGGSASPSWQDIILSGNTALTLTNALANGLNYLKLFGGTEQRNLPSEYTQVNYVTNTAKTWLDTGVKFDFSKNYEIELRVRGVTGSWYILQARENSSALIYGISGSQNNNTIILSFNGSTTNPTQVTRVVGNIYYVKGTINNGSLTLYVKDETAGTEETVTGTYTPTTGQSVNIGLFGNGVIGAGGQQVVEINSDVYFARIKEDGNYILNYVSCRQVATAGFYDKVSGTFKTTTNLLAGDDATPSPDTPMDILSNNGVLKLSPNLVEFNETRINSSTWDSADKTKGFEVYADVYNKSVGDNMLINANSFGVFVPCKQGESISLDFFNYEPFYSRCLYCEITADRKCNTTPQAYENAGVITQKTFTLTKSDSIGFIFEWYINAQQTRNYTASNYMIVKGSTPPTKYIPYGQIYTDGTQEVVTDSLGNTANAEMLLKVGDYKDEQSVIDGGVSRNVGIKVFDGTENWDTGSSAYSNRFTLAGAFNDIAQMPNANVGYSNCYTVIARSTSIQQNLQNNECGWNTTYVFCLRDDRFTTVAQFKQFLADQYNAGFPVIVVYPLAESTTESVSGQPLTTQAGTNIVEITQGSVDGLGLEVSYKATV